MNVHILTVQDTELVYDNKCMVRPYTGIHGCYATRRLAEQAQQALAEKYKGLQFIDNEGDWFESFSVIGDILNIYEYSIITHDLMKGKEQDENKNSVCNSEECLGV